MDSAFSSLTPSRALFEHTRYFGLRYITALAVAALLAIFSLIAFLPTSNFPTGQILVIPSGASLSETASILKESRAIDSARLFSLYLRLTGNAGNVHAGTYRFDHPLGLVAVAGRVAAGMTGVAEIRITIPEGFTSRDMSTLFAASLPGVTAKDFLTLAAPHEGYLFPDTYSFLPNATSSDIVSTMLENFDTRTASITPAELMAARHSLADVVTMASLVEKEAKTPQDRRMVAGILWNRVKLGMRLQVDAVFGYIDGDETHTPTTEDLTSPSPYNTYTNAGLPPGPIDNPGLDSIEAALYPATTTDLYYLTGKDGTMHYAKTLAEHDANIQKYL